MYYSQITSRICSTETYTIYIGIIWSGKIIGWLDHCCLISIEQYDIVSEKTKYTTVVRNFAWNEVSPPTGRLTVISIP
jgi:hypothetical protein